VEATREPGIGLEPFNDSCDKYEEIQHVIAEARRLAAADIEQHQPARLAA
jgi:hypothetical protein